MKLSLGLLAVGSAIISISSVWAVGPAGAGVCAFVAIPDLRMASGTSECRTGPCIAVDCGNNRAGYIEGQVVAEILVLKYTADDGAGHLVDRTISLRGDDHGNVPKDLSDYLQVLQAGPTCSAVSKMLDWNKGISTNQESLARALGECSKIKDMSLDSFQKSPSSITIYNGLGKGRQKIDADHSALTVHGTLCTAVESSRNLSVPPPIQLEMRNAPDCNQKLCVEWIRCGAPVKDADGFVVKAVDVQGPVACPSSKGTSCPSPNTCYNMAFTPKR